MKLLVKHIAIITYTEGENFIVQEYVWYSYLCACGVFVYSVEIPVIEFLSPEILYLRNYVNNSLFVMSYFYVGMRRLCWHNFGHNRYVWKSGIMLAFGGDYKVLTVGKSTDCTIPLKEDRNTLIEQS